MEAKKEIKEEIPVEVGASGEKNWKGRGGSGGRREELRKRGKWGVGLDGVMVLGENIWKRKGWLVEKRSEREGLVGEREGLVVGWLGVL